MYNYRYHLVTILSIFAALAIGLLLGVALTGSDLVRDASSNLAKTLTEQFDELSAKNRELSEQLKTEKLFANQLAAGWQKDRLRGRTIAILTNAPAENDPLTDELNALIQRSGGMCVVIRIDELDGFGLENNQVLAALRQLVPERQNEDYRETLARTLAAEWSYTYSNGDADTAGITGFESTSGSNTTGSASDMSATYKNDTPIPIEIEIAFDQNYPVTRELIKAGYLEITVFYRPALDGAYSSELSGSATGITQQAAYRHAQMLGLPYGVNGVINTVVYQQVPGMLTRLDMTTIQILRQFTLLGQAGKLPYLFSVSDEAAFIEEATKLKQDQNLSYYALMVQSEEHADFLLAEAWDRGISCVFSDRIDYRDYSVIALLTGATNGIYGPDLPGIQPFPMIPTDTKGNTSFLRR